MNTAHDEVIAGYERVWRELVAGVVNRRHGFRTFTLATVGADGLPSARTMVLREADEKSRLLRFHLDARSPKFAELKARPPVCALFYGEEERLQVRVSGTATLDCGSGECRAVWNALPPMSREAYRTPFAPTAPRAAEVTAEPLSIADAFANFAVCRITVRTLEWLSLSSAGHRRVRHGFGENGAVETHMLHP